LVSDVHNCRVDSAEDDLWCVLRCLSHRGDKP
jgi:hypothetical protein